MSFNTIAHGMRLHSPMSDLTAADVAPDGRWARGRAGGRLWAVFAPRLPGGTAARGMLYSVGPWLLAQLVVMPMMGAGLFSGSMLVAAGSLMGHVVYGAVLGAAYGLPRPIVQGQPRLA